MGAINKWIADNYGSKQGLLKTIWYKFIYAFGCYKKSKDIDWERINRFVFVCTGNICRSAFAEQVARTHGVDAISCGIRAIEGAPANTQAAMVADKMGYDLSQHKTTPMMYVELTGRDLLIVMEPEQMSFLEDNAAVRYTYTMLGVWGKRSMPYLHDPYGCSLKYFECCFKTIEEAVLLLKSKSTIKK